MLLFVGLGNPGSDYAKNRHNAGFMAVDWLARQHGFSDWKAKSGALIADGRLATSKVILAKPQSFMNKSGLPTVEIARFYKIQPQDIFVFYDEIDLAAGKIRIKQGGGHGGHNGIRDLDRHLGKDYWRVRIGVGRPERSGDVHRWVLSDFAKDEQNGWLERLLSAMSDEADRLASHDTAGFQSRVAYLAPAPQADKENTDNAEEENGI